jgi:hypothetical protein
MAASINGRTAAGIASHNMRATGFAKWGYETSGMGDGAPAFWYGKPNLTAGTMPPMFSYR